MTSAFGVDHGDEVSKAFKLSKPKIPKMNLGGGAGGPQRAINASQNIRPTIRKPFENLGAKIGSAAQGAGMKAKINASAKPKAFGAATKFRAGAALQRFGNAAAANPGKTGAAAAGGAAAAAGGAGYGGGYFASRNKKPGQR